MDSCNVSVRGKTGFADFGRPTIRRYGEAGTWADSERAILFDRRIFAKLAYEANEDSVVN